MHIEFWLNVRRIQVLNYKKIIKKLMQFIKDDANSKGYKKSYCRCFFEAHKIYLRAKEDKVIDELNIVSTRS